MKLRIEYFSLSLKSILSLLISLIREIELILPRFGESRRSENWLAVMFWFFKAFASLIMHLS